MTVMFIYVYLEATCLDVALVFLDIMSPYNLVKFEATTSLYYMRIKNWLFNQYWINIHENKSLTDAARVAL
jgi:hypothetical protein